MPKTVDNFIGYKIGDIITLSDLQTQKEFNEMSVDFRIKEVRTYREPSGLFKYTGYIAGYKPKDSEEENIIMLMVRQIDDDYDLLVYYMDNEGPAGDFGPLFLVTESEEDENTEEDDEESVDVEINIGDDSYANSDYEDEEAQEDEEDEEDGPDEDLVKSFEVDMDTEKGTSHVTWVKKTMGTVFGVDVNSTDTGKDVKTIAEYATDDDTDGNPHCFIEWTGDTEEGYLEMWYGCDVEPELTEMYHTKR